MTNNGHAVYVLRTKLVGCKAIRAAMDAPSIGTSVRPFSCTRKRCFLSESGTLRSSVSILLRRVQPLVAPAVRPAI
jgi:hypothetical protein